jgi:hypothetical protein
MDEINGVFIPLFLAFKLSVLINFAIGLIADILDLPIVMNHHSEKITCQITGCI